MDVRRLDYQARTFLNDIWSSDGVTWTKHGARAWPQRGSHTVVVYQINCGCSEAPITSPTTARPDGFLNDVWMSQTTVLTGHR